MSEQVSNNKTKRNKLVPASIAIERPGAQWLVSPTSSKTYWIFAGDSILLEPRKPELGELALLQHIGRDGEIEFRYEGHRAADGMLYGSTYVGVVLSVIRSISEERLVALQDLSESTRLPQLIDSPEPADAVRSLRFVATALRSMGGDYSAEEMVECAPIIDKAAETLENVLQSLRDWPKSVHI